MVHLEPIHGRCLICFEDRPFDVFRTGCGAPPNDVVGVCKDCTTAAVAARNARRAQSDAGDVEALVKATFRIYADWWNDNLRRDFREYLEDPNYRNRVFAELREGIIAYVLQSVAAREAQLRGALAEAGRDFDYIARLARPTDFPHGSLGTVRDTVAISKPKIDTALAIPASDAAQRYAALERFWYEYERGAKGDRRGAAEALRVLDRRHGHNDVNP